MKVIAGILIWMLLGVPGMGWSHAEFHYEFADLAKGSGDRDDVGFRVMHGVVFGPMSSGMIFLLTGFGQYGWMLHMPQAVKEIKE